MISEQDRKYLRRCIELAKAALAAGDQPFGSLLVSARGEVLFEDHNRVSGGDATRHPEFEIARWAAQNLRPEERAQATVYTSGEHCAMCAAAHGWVGLGRIVYASSSAQLRTWLSALGVPSSRVYALPINEVIADTVVDGPDDGLAEEVHQLQVRYYATANGR
ncbi:nucleoside deaminase [Bordetella muralis]